MLSVWLIFWFRVRVLSLVVRVKVVVSLVLMVRFGYLSRVKLLLESELVV